MSDRRCKKQHAEVASLRQYRAFAKAISREGASHLVQLLTPIQHALDSFMQNDFGFI